MSLRAFVTGGTGFAGSHLCRRLVGLGWPVRALARRGSDRSGLEAAGVEIWNGDVRDPASLAGALRGTDVVFHLAALFREAGRPEADYHAVNVDGTRHVAEAAGRAGVARFVHCSTVGVHGDTGASPAREASPLVEADDPYNCTKLRGEQTAREIFARLGVPGVVVRPSAGYGPGEMRYAKLLRSVARGRFVMIGAGKNRQNLAYIDDLCDGLVLAATRPEAVGETFILGGDDNVALADLVRRVARAVGVAAPRLRIPAWPVTIAALACETACRPFGIEPPLHRRRVGFFTVSRAFDISKARELLGYRPRVDLDEGLARTAAWCRGAGLL